VIIKQAVKIPVWLHYMAKAAATSCCHWRTEIGIAAAIK